MQLDDRRDARGEPVTHEEILESQRYYAGKIALLYDYWRNGAQAMDFDEFCKRWVIETLRRIEHLLSQYEEDKQREHYGSTERSSENSDR
jgi:hypothetical protein